MALAFILCTCRAPFSLSDRSNPVPQNAIFRFQFKSLLTNLLDGLVEGLASNKVWDVVIVLLLGALLLLHALVALGQLAQGGKGVWAELVEDTWNELGELLVLTGTVDGEGVGWDGSVDCALLDHNLSSYAVLHLQPRH